MSYIYKGYTVHISGSTGLWRYFIIATPQGVLTKPIVSTKYHATKNGTIVSAKFFIDKLVKA